MFYVAFLLSLFLSGTAYSLNLVDACRFALEKNTTYLNKLSQNQINALNYHFFPGSVEADIDNENNAVLFPFKKFSFDISPSTFYKYKNLSVQTQKKEVDDKLSTSQILHKVSHTYIDLITLVKNHKSIRFEAKINRDQYQLAQKKYQQGLISEQELKTWEYEFSKSESKMLKNTMAIEKKKLELEQMILSDIKTLSFFSNKQPVNITRTIPFIGKQQYALQSAKFAATSQDLTYSELQLAASFPKLSLHLDASDTNTQSPQVSLRSTWTFPFADLNTLVAIESQRLKTLKAKREHLFNSWKLPRTNQFEKKQIRLARNLVKTSTIGYKTALHRFRISKKNYREGLITQLQLNDSIRGVTKARQSIIESQARLLREYIDLLLLNNQLNMDAITRIQRLFTTRSAL